MKEYGHKEIPNISLIPINDPSLLFVNSGMFPLVNYLMGETHPLGKRLTNFQRSIRTLDIDEVGDNRHHTLFEMVGNWSLGDFFKEVQLPLIMKLYVEGFGLDINRMYVTVFQGDEVAPKDEESIALWKEIYKKYGIDAEYTDNPTDIGKGNFRIFGLGKKENWWQRGNAPGELGGPDSEMYYDLQVSTNPNWSGEHAIDDDSGRYLEIGNNVFMQFKLNNELKWEPLPQKNVDFGGGFERIVACVQGVVDNYDTDLFMPIIREVELLSGKKWKDEEINDEIVRERQNFNFRAIADHIRASVFIIADGITPSNKDQGYILRRLVRRMIRKAMSLGIENNFARKLAGIVIEEYKDSYPNIKENEDLVLNAIEKEEINFRKTLNNGVKEFQKVTALGVKFTGQEAFRLYETFGFPIELTIEELENEINDKGDFSEVDKLKLIEDFKEAEKNHKNQSRAGAEKKFKGGLADQTTETTRLHTSHHLLLSALQKVLGSHVHQKGSNITSERLRIDFSHNEKLTDEQIEEVENLVNNMIDRNLIVEKKTMPRTEAEKIGAEMEFGAKYGDLVDVYFIRDENTNEIISKEFCGGPHVSNTSEIRESGTFRIGKQESSGAGTRRIKASLVK